MTKMLSETSSVGKYTVRQMLATSVMPVNEHMMENRLRGTATFSVNNNPIQKA